MSRIGLPLALLVLTLLRPAEARACIPPSYQWVQEHTDVIVEGTFVIDSEARGEGRIISKIVSKGRYRKFYLVRWDPQPELTLQPQELDCIVAIPESGQSEGFNLKREGNGWYSVIRRWQRLKKER